MILSYYFLKSIYKHYYWKMALIKNSVKDLNLKNIKWKLKKITHKTRIGKALSCNLNLMKQKKFVT